MRKEPLPALLVSLLLVPLFGSGCSSPAEDPTTQSLVVDATRRPQSAYAALIRALEVMDAIRDPEAEVRLRAVECDAIVEEGRGRQYVRIVFDLTVISEHYSKSQEVFESLVRALEAEARVSGRAEIVVEDRVDRTFREMTWTPSFTPPRGAFQSLVSLSDSIRIEVYPGERAYTEESHAVQGAFPTQALGEYVRTIAAIPEVSLGPLTTTSRIVQYHGRPNELRYDIVPSDDAAFTRHQLGEFLFQLEYNSPGVAITHLLIEPSDPRSDVEMDLWTFEMSLSMTLRARDDD